MAGKKKRIPHPKSNNAEIDKKVFDIMILFDKSYKRRDIIEYAKINNWGLCNNSIDKYIEKARNRIKEFQDKEAEAKRAIRISQIEFQLKKANDDDDINNALKAINLAGEFEGSKSPIKTNNIHTIDTKQQLVELLENSKDTDIKGV